MATKPDKPDDEARCNSPEGEAAEERPTVSPPFDPAAFAREVLEAAPKSAASPHTKPTPAAGMRARAPTYTDAEELEAARRRSMEVGSRRPTPTGALSLVNARIPSNLPPPPPQAATPRERARGGASSSPTARESLRRDGDAPPTIQEMTDRFSVGDYSGALEIADKLLVNDPKNEHVLMVASRCRGVLRQMYTTKIGPLDRVPVVTVPRDQLRWLSIDHRAGFVLSLVDGVSSLDMILDVSGMPELDALRILCELAQQRIISFR